ncbi:unnamed protein product [Musa hybrid cultivar]
MSHFSNTGSLLLFLFLKCFTMDVRRVAEELYLVLPFLSVHGRKLIYVATRVPQKGCYHRQVRAHFPCALPGLRQLSRTPWSTVASRAYKKGKEGVEGSREATLDRGRKRRDMQPASLLHILLLISHLASAVPVDLHSHGCFWTESCQSKWVGGCSAGLVVVDRSDNCNGLCGESKFPPCLPFHTHFHCCKPENPRLTNKCTICKNKLDFGDEYICCTDCSDPYLIEKNRKLGYCKTGAVLAVQLKPQEVFKWVAGPWMKCSSPCDGGVRYRDVGCYGSTDDPSIKRYPVDDSRCSDQEMPLRQEPCNLQSCGDLSISESSDKPSGMSGWLVALLVILGLVAVGGVGFAGYICYKRKTSAPSGFVYIMLEGYS